MINCVQQRVNDEQNHMLMQPITSKEVKVAAFSMHPNKSAGINGFNLGFFPALLGYSR